MTSGWHLDITRSAIRTSFGRWDFPPTGQLAGHRQEPAKAGDPKPPPGDCCKPYCKQFIFKHIFLDSASLSPTTQLQICNLTFSSSISAPWGSLRQLHLPAFFFFFLTCTLLIYCLFYDSRKRLPIRGRCPFSSPDQVEHLQLT